MESQSKQQRKRPLTKKFKFTMQEDRMLKILVNEHGKDWPRIALRLPGRTARQCRDRWTNYIDPNISIRPWTQQEDFMLLQKYSEIGPHWRLISVNFPGRSINNVRNRTVKLLKYQQKQCSESNTKEIFQTSPEDDTIKDQISYHQSQQIPTQIEIANPLISLEEKNLHFDSNIHHLFDVFGQQETDDLHTTMTEEPDLLLFL